MISAIVLAPDLPPDADPAKARAVIVRSLVWLVSAVVSGVVRDVVLAASERLDLAAVVDESGCLVANGRSEADRLARAAALGRGDLLLVVRSGFLPEPALVDELAALLRVPGPAQGVLLATPETAWQRLFAERTPVVGVMASRAQVADAGGFAALARHARHAPRLRARAARIA